MRVRFLASLSGLGIQHCGVPLVAQWKQIWLVSMRTQVQSMVLLCGLRIRRCHELWCRWQMRLVSSVAVAVAVV